MKDVVTISKFDAARRQLETAIRLYFYDGDPVSIHTLASASYNVLRDINKKVGGTPMLMKEYTLGFAKPEFREEVRRIFNEAENFFKHADKDHDQQLKFIPELTELYLWDCCAKYQQLTGETVPIFQACTAWVMIKHEELFIMPDEFKELRLKAKQEAQSFPKAQFLEATLPILMRKGMK